MANLLDRALGYLSPAWGLSRTRARRQLQLSNGAGYKRAKGSRLISGAGGGGADYHLENDLSRRDAVDKSRELVRNNSFAEAMATRNADLVVGATGIQPRPVVKGPVGEKQLALWRAFCEPQNCTVRGMSSWAELQRMLVRARLVDGDVGVIRRSNGKLQVFHSDELSNPAKHWADPMFRDGVELDANGAPFAFHLVDGIDQVHSANRRYAQGHTRVPSRHVCWLPRRMTEDQTRGLPAFASNLHLYEHLDKLIEAVVVAARMAACYGLVITSDNGPPDTGQYETDGKGIPHTLEKFWPGIVAYLEEGESVEQLNPNQSLGSLSEAMKPILRTLGLPVGIPLEVLLMDMSGLNYSMSRGLMLQVYRTITPDQLFLINHLCKPVWRWLTLRWIAEGELPPDPMLLMADWNPPARELVDPLKDLQAHALALDLGLTDEDALATAMGIDLDVVLQKRHEILERKKALGLPVVQSTGTRDAGQAGAEPEQDDASEDEDGEDQEDPDGDKEDE